MAENFLRTKASEETVPFWRRQIAHAREVSRKHKEAMRCEELRRITSENSFGNLMFSDDIDKDDNPQVDQVDINYMLRYLDKMRALVGDEEPEVRFERSKSAPRGQKEDGTPITPSTIGEAFDRLISGAMSMAGAPEENSESIANYATDGLAVFWWDLTGLPTLQEAISASQTTGAEVAAGQGDGSFVGRLDDHEKKAQGIQQAALSDPDAIEDQVATHESGQAPFQKALGVAAEHLKAARREDQSKTPLYWRAGKFNLQETRYVYGERFLWDSSVTRYRDARWVARLLEMSPDEAKSFPLFRPSVREKLETSPFVDEDGKEYDLETAGDETIDDGVVRIWHIEDKKFGQQLYFPDAGGNQFLYDGPSSYLDGNGDWLIPAVGPYPGFFPAYGDAIKKLTYLNSPRNIQGMPLLLPGIDIQLALIKAVSKYHEVVKRASAQHMLVDNDLFQEHGDALRRGNSTIMKKLKGSEGKDAAEIIAFRPPPADLFAIIDRFTAMLSAALNFPLVEMLSSPQADTATQEELAVGAGNLNVFETIRRMEVVYSVGAHICTHLIFGRLRDSGLIEELVGVEDAEIIKQAWDAGFFPKKLPMVTMAPKARNQGNFVRTKQLLDIHARAKEEIDRATGGPRLDGIHLLQEAAKSTGFGAIPAYDATMDERVRTAAQLLVQGLIESGQLVPAPEGEAEPKQSGGANNKGDQSKGERPDRERRRDSDEGRSRKQPRPRGTETGNARDAGPVAVS
ncbi:MAG: hypothetical protein ACPHCN_08425 [Mycobacterium sp.]